MESKNIRRALFLQYYQGGDDFSLNNKADAAEALNRFLEAICLYEKGRKSCQCG